MKKIIEALILVPIAKRWYGIMAREMGAKGFVHTWEEEGDICKRDLVDAFAEMFGFWKYGGRW